MESLRHDDISTLIDELKVKGRLVSSTVEATFQAVLHHLFVSGVSLEEASLDR